MPHSRDFVLIFIISGAWLLSGCSIHPLPEDISPKATVDIVEQLRCEASAGIVASHIPESEYAKHHIGYDFTLDMQEYNKLEGGKLELTELLTGGSLKLAFNGGFEKARGNKRFFRLTETFAHLVETTREHCGSAGRADFIYPIAGKVGLDEIVITYGRLGRLSGFAKQSDKGNVVFSDTVTFTTTMTAGISPTLTLAARSHGFKATSATVNDTNQRKDTNMVVVAMAPDQGAGFGIQSIDFGARGFVINSTPLVSRAAQIPGNPAAAVINELDRIRALTDPRLSPLQVLP